jgi:hypothetical protein
MALKKVNPIKKQYLTAIEVSKMLGGTISRAKIRRYLDQGILTGWKHPVTGWRLIDRKSVEALKRRLRSG